MKSKMIKIIYYENSYSEKSGVATLFLERDFKNKLLPEIKRIN